MSLLNYLRPLALHLSTSLGSKDCKLNTLPRSEPTPAAYSPSLIITNRALYWRSNLCRALCNSSALGCSVEHHGLHLGAGDQGERATTVGGNGTGAAASLEQLRLSCGYRVSDRLWVLVGGVSRWYQTRRQDSTVIQILRAFLGVA
jgi:hypothetical protein